MVQAAAQQAAETTGDVESVSMTAPESENPGEEENPEETPKVVIEPAPPELMTPRQFKAAGLGPANDATILKAVRQHKPVSALAVDEYNLKHSLPKGYECEGDRFVFKAPDSTPSKRTKVGKAAGAAKRPSPTVQVVARKPGRIGIAV